MNDCPIDTLLNAKLISASNHNTLIAFRTDYERAAIIPMPRMKYDGMPGTATPMISDKQAGRFQRFIGANAALKKSRLNHFAWRLLIDEIEWRPSLFAVRKLIKVLDRFYRDYEPVPAA